MAADMNRKVNSEKLIALDPLNSEKRQKIFDDILSTGGVTSEKEFLSVNADKDSI
jgi:hypothetical protein